MNASTYANRRTVLRSIPATAFGSSFVTGTASARRDLSDATCDEGTDLEIVARHDHDEDEHRFELDTTEVSAGWTAVSFENRTEHTHFAYIAKLPQEAIDAADEADADLLEFYVERVTNPFQGIMDDIVGEDPRHDPELPEWFEGVQPSGGPGLTSGGTTSETTVDLEPGEYIVECYVKEANEPYQDFHSYRGMIELLTVTEERDGDEPQATFELSLSTDGIAVEGVPTPGQHTVAVRFDEQEIHDHLLGHDVHLVRLDEATTVDDVDGWMNWMDPDQLISDGTEPGTFLGGVQTILTPGLLAGEETKTAYFHVDLNPGAYALVSEVPAPRSGGFLETFTVSFDDRGEIDPAFGYPAMDAADLPAAIDPDHEVELAVAPPAGAGQPPFLYFDPIGLGVDPGDVVQFTFLSPDHTVTAYHPGIGHERRVPEGVPAFSSPVMGPGSAWLYRFDHEGVYDVNCAPHQILGMVMRLVVGDLAEGDVPEYARTVEGLPSKEDFEEGLNALSEHNEDCEWPFLMPAEVLGAEPLDPTSIQEAGAVPFADVAEDLGYEFQPSGGDSGEE